MAHTSNMKLHKLIKIIALNLLSLLILVILISIAGEIYLRIYHHIEPQAEGAGLKIFQSSDLTTWEHKPFSKDENVYINNIGLRDNDFTYNDSQKNILMIGDSFTFGTTTDLDKTFVKITEKNLKGWNVINAGTLGYSVDQYYLALKRLCPIIKPKIVVVNLFVGNDITELRRHKLQDEKVLDQEIFVNENNQLASWTNKEPASYFLNFIQKRFAILKNKLGKTDDRPTLTWPVFLQESDKGYDPNLPMYWEKFFTALNQINNFAKENNITLVYTIIPMDVQVSKSYWNKYSVMFFNEDAFEQKRPQKKILKYCQENNLNCLDLLPILASDPSKDSLYYKKDDPHFDLAGHLSTGNAITNYLNNFITKYE